MVHNTHSNEHNGKRAAVIDIGTANVKFVIADIASGLIATVYKDQKRTFIEGIELGGTATEGTLALNTALTEFKATMQEYNVDAYRVLGTESLRRSEGSGNVLTAIAASIGSPVEVLSQDQEAALFFNAVSSQIPGDLAVVDVGAGSVQLSIGQNKQLERAYLLKTGTMLLDRDFLGSVFPRGEAIEKVWQYVESEIAKLHLPPSAPKRLVFGSTRILTFFRNMNVGAEDARSSSTHPRKARLQDVVAVYEKLIPLSEEERKAFFSTEPFFMRGADLALINVICVCKALGINEIIPTNLNLSDGVLLSLG